MLQIYDLRPKLVLFYLPAIQEDAYLGSANYEINNAAAPAFWLANSDGAALAAALANAAADSAAANAPLQLTGLVNVGLPLPEGVAMQPSLIGSRGPVSKADVWCNGQQRIPRTPVHCLMSSCSVVYMC
jgi:hypothetical protein